MSVNIMYNIAYSNHGFAITRWSCGVIGTLGGSPWEPLGSLSELEIRAPLGHPGDLWGAQEFSTRSTFSNSSFKLFTFRDSCRPFGFDNMTRRAVCSSMLVFCINGLRPLALKQNTKMVQLFVFVVRSPGNQYVIKICILNSCHFSGGWWRLSRHHSHYPIPCRHCKSSCVVCLVV